MKYKLSSFSGICPALDSRLVKDDVAQTAHNCFLKSGKIIPLKENKQIKSAAPGIRSIYKHHDEWIMLTYDADFEKSPINEDKYDRVYYTGHPDGYLRMRGKFDGRNYSERRVFVPRPASPPKVTSSTYWKVAKEDLAFTPAWGFDSPRQVAKASSFDQTESGSWSAVFHIEESYSDAGAFIASEATGSGTLAMGKRSIRLTDGTGELKIYKPNSELYATVYISLVSLVADAPSDKTGVFIFAGQTLTLEITVSMASSEQYRSYCYTFVDDIGQEGPPSDVSEVISSFDGDTVTVKIYPKIKNPDDGNDDDDNSMIIRPVPIPLPPTINPAFRPQTFSVSRAIGVIPLPPNMSDPDYKRPNDDILTSDVFDGSIKKIRLYRTGGTEINADFYFVKEVPYATEIEFIDDVMNTALGERLIRCENPPLKMTSLISCVTGSFAACKGRDLYFCEPYQPNNWPTSYNYVTANSIVGIAPSGSSVFALTAGEPEIFSGSHPEAMSQYKSSLKQACMSKKSICTADSKVLFASPDGMISLSSDTSAQIITKNHFRREQWLELNPVKMICSVHDEKLHIFAGSLCLIFDFSEGLSLTTAAVDSSDKKNPEDLDVSTEKVFDLYADNIVDTLYMLSSGIKAWNCGSANRIAIYKTKMIEFNFPVNFSIARVIMEKYNSESKFSIFAPGPIESISAGENNSQDPEEIGHTSAGGNENTSETDSYYTSDSNIRRYACTVKNDLGFRLPYLRRQREWYVEVKGNYQINSLEIANSNTALKE